MAKRQADEQITKDENDGSSEEEVIDERTRAQPLAPVEGRAIRGLPKRKTAGAGGAVATSSPPVAPPSTSSPFSGFNFGASSTPSFGAAPTSSAPAFGTGFGSKPASSAGQVSTGFGGTTGTSTPAPAPAAPKPFAGFSFGGASAAPSNSASSSTNNTSAPAFGAPSASTSASKPAFSFGSSTPPATSSATATQPSAPTSTTPAAPPKPFAGFSFSKPAAPPAPAPKPAAQPDAEAKSSRSSSTLASSSVGANGTLSAPKLTPTPSRSDPPPEGEVSYYTAIRGINAAILNALTGAIEKDPFIDLSSSLRNLSDQYGNHLDEAVKKAGWQPEGSKKAVNGELNGTGSSSTKLSAPAAPASLPKMPAPPAVGTFTLPKPSSTSSTPSSGGFVPNLSSSTPKAPFTFGSTTDTQPSSSSSSAPATTTSASKSASKPSAEVTKLVEDVIADRPKSPEKPATSTPAKASIFSFGSGSGDSTKPAPALFSFAPSQPLKPTTPDSKTFTPSKSLEEASPAKLGKFGPGGSQPQLSFGGAKASPAGAATPGSSKPFAFSFGAASGTTPSSTPGSTFTFGGAAPGPAPAPKAGMFAPSSTSGFSFGNSSTGLFGQAPKPSSSPAFSFGSAPISASATPPNEASAGQEDGETAGEAAAAASEPSTNLASATGKGEENEDTALERRGKLMKLSKGEWVAQGVGQFKIKKEKDSEKRRLLMRSDGVGNILLNMTLADSFKPTAEGAYIKFLGFDAEGTPTNYSLRVKTPAAAKEVEEKLKAEAASSSGS